ncbi:MAG TPA: VTT domain-containing protein [Flavisolibacter sp.]|nr:VTT domain-containing protein [Flavisolibacter sp.]
MKEQLLQLFEQNPGLAVLISLGFSILIALLGLVPSFFITAANILFFGFWPGVLLSFAGEALGAMVAFILYRKGFKKEASRRLERFPMAMQLTNAQGRQAFLLVLSLRLIPFVPSGLITFAAAIGRISLPVFFLASSLGKIPALLLEGYSVYELTRFSTAGKIILALLGIGIIIYLVKTLKREKETRNPGH